MQLGPDGDAGFRAGSESAGARPCRERLAVRHSARMGRMRLRYDDPIGAAYLTLGDPAERKMPLSQQTVGPPNPSGGDDYLVLDFDAAGRLVGIEVLVPDDRLLPSAI